MKSGSSGARRGVRRAVTLSAKDEDGEEGVRMERGLRDSSAMVARRPKCSLPARRELNWETSSWDAAGQTVRRPRES